MLIIKKPIISFLSLFSAICAAGLLISSCTNTGTTGGKDGDSTVCVPNPKDSSALAKIDHYIPIGEIKEYKAAFTSANDSLKRSFPSLLVPDAEAYNKAAILEILKDPRSVGIRIYHGVKTGGKIDELRLIIVGVDAQGKDLYITRGSAAAAQASGGEGGAEHGQCPTCQN
jgi:hypothetical protein